MLQNDQKNQSDDYNKLKNENMNKNCIHTVLKRTISFKDCEYAFNTNDKHKLF